MSAPLYRLARGGEINWLSYYFADFIATQSFPEDDALVICSAALLCEASLGGDVCIDLERLVDKPLFDSTQVDPAEFPQSVDSADWRRRLQASICVGAPGETTPLTLDGKKLYLNRFWLYEKRVAEAINVRLRLAPEIEPARLEREVERLFADAAPAEQEQRRAVSLACARRFCVVSGGPGTGKTTTIIKILATLIALQPGMRIALAAPTGKAAARMIESIEQRADQIDISRSTRQAMPTRASTLHRLLGYRRCAWQYHAHHRLPFDCVIVDEASMIDLQLMYRLVEALPDPARIILLGDRDQLASVSAGNVLGDITGHGQDPGESSATVAEAIVLLRHSYRFGTASGIGKLAALVKLGASTDALALLGDSSDDIAWYQLKHEAIDPSALDWVLSAYQPLFAQNDVGEALDVYARTRVLAATNRGPLGVDAINQLVSEHLLARNRLVASELFHGLPIMINRNQHDLELYNGDTGILWQSENGLRAWFRDTGSSTRSFALNRLLDFSPAWASTVHKSQGDEFDSVLLILPVDMESEVLSRELLYTAITRARRRFLLHATSAATRRAIENLTRRHSGLGERLGWPGES